MGLNRGNKMWQGFFITEHREALEKMQWAEEDFHLPELTEDRWQEIQYVIEEALEGEYSIDCEYVKENQLHSFCGFVERINLHEKWLLLVDGSHKQRIPFAQLYSVELVKDDHD